ncbi:MAG: glycosyltransferase [Anaerolineales bacterium]|nr:glycosyltransferase [Anaerolineales bacterium]
MTAPRYRMRILHIIPYFYPAWAYGGTCRAAWELARALVRKQQQVVVYTTDALDAHARAKLPLEVVDGVEIHRVRNLSNYLAWGRAFFPLGFGRQLRAALGHADVAHLHEFRSYQNSVALPLMEKMGVPFVLTAQGGLPRIMGRHLLKILYDRMVGQRILRNAARLHALNEMEREQFIDLGVEPERVAILPNGVDLEQYRSLPPVNGFRARFGVPEDVPIVLFLARVNKIKGVDFLVSSFDLLLRVSPQAVLVIVGPDDGYLTEVKRQVQTLGISSQVRFTGYLDGDDKLQAYQSASVYVLPSAYEMFAITLLESLACGTPIIATDRCGLADFVRQNDLGSIVNYGDVGGLQNEITRILSLPRDVQRRAGYGRQYVLDNFGWDRIAENWLKVYRDCVVGN